LSKQEAGQYKYTAYAAKNGTHIPYPLSDLF
jgi:hypothetical protein